MVIGTIAIRQNKPLYVFCRALTAIPTPSMEGDLDDSLHVGDLAIIRKGQFSEVEVGNIIVFQGTYQSYEFLIIHRVIEITDEGFITQGDANSRPDDGFVTEETYQGIYVSKITWLRPVANFVTDGSGRTLIFGLIVIILIIVLFTEMLHILRTITRTQKEQVEQRYDAEVKAFIQHEKERLEEEHNKKSES